MTSNFKKSRFMTFSLFTILCFHLFTACNDTSTDITDQKTGKDSAAVVAAAVPVVDSSKLILPKIPKSALDSTSRVVYFTMDDGPLQPSNVLIQVAEEKQVKISEFAVGLHALSNKKFMEHLNGMKRSPYMEVCNHSYSHAYNQYAYFYSNPQKAADDIIGNESKLNLTSKIVRMPGRDIWSTSTFKRGWKQSGGKTAEILTSEGFKIYGWDCEWEHFGNTLPKKSPEGFVAMVDDLFRRNAMATPNHLVILGHDEMLIKEKGRQDFRQIVDMLKERGYIFEFISNYPN
jgi:peptidoglycan/xylan/chitin deacetylase (PgdA/CDA1 family)